MKITLTSDKKRIELKYAKAGYRIDWASSSVAGVLGFDSTSKLYDADKHTEKADVFSDTSDYELNTKIPMIDLYNTLQLRTSVSQAVSSLGKPAPILAQWSVPRGTLYSSHFDYTPPQPVRVPCSVPTPVSQMSIRLTNVYGQLAGCEDPWSATLILAY